MVVPDDHMARIVKPYGPFLAELVESIAFNYNIPIVE
jgi:hypothetical protein